MWSPPTVVVLTLPAGTLAKSVYTELEDLHHQGFKTWVSRIEDIVDSLGVTVGGGQRERIQKKLSLEGD